MLVHAIERDVTFGRHDLE